MDDRQIIHMLWQRLEQAIDVLAEKYGRRLQRTAMNILANSQDAEEAVNDTYLALWNAIPPARPDPLAAYVCRSALDRVGNFCAAIPASQPTERLFN